MASAHSAAKPIVAQIGVPEPDYLHKPVAEDYDIHWDKPLGTGVNGSVLTCYSKATGERCALKLLEPTLAARREIALHMKLGTHPNIVRAIAAYDCEMAIVSPTGLTATPRRMLSLITECMEGGELFDRIREKGTFTEEEASGITRQIAEALVHLHLHKVAHRDIKPENLLFDSRAPDAKLKLIDFGFAKVDRGDTLQTPVYTPYYAAPQVLESQSHQQKKKANLLPTSETYAYDLSCDMWSVGVVLYILLCGYVPFRDTKNEGVMTFVMRERIRKGLYAFHDKYWSCVSDDAKDVVRGLLNIDAVKRTTAAQLRRSAWVRGDGVLATPLHTAKLLKETPNEEQIADRNAFEEELMQMRARNTVKLKPASQLRSKLMARRAEAQPASAAAAGTQ